MGRGWPDRECYPILLDLGFGHTVGEAEALYKRKIVLYRRFLRTLMVLSFSDGGFVNTLRDGGLVPLETTQRKGELLTVLYGAVVGEASPKGSGTV